MVTHQPIVSQLIELLEERPDLAIALGESIHNAHDDDVVTLDDYYQFLDRMVTLIPNDRNLNAVLLKFYFLIDQSSAETLQKDSSFQRWSRAFAADWGNFLDTIESARDLERFYSDTAYHMDDYCVSPSGWLTFNQFFARQVRPGKRPVDSLCDDRIVVSPADSVFKGAWPIQSDSNVTVKDLTWSIVNLLDSSPYQHRFRDGIFTHSYLDVNDYHRFHVPVRGTILEVRKIPGNVTMDVIKKPDGSLDTIDGTGYQFTQDRGLIIIDSPLGLVGVLPIGMAQVSSVNLTAQVGTELHKGEEFGFFSFGGSDIVTLFEAGKVTIDAQLETHYNQGRRIGCANAR